MGLRDRIDALERRSAGGDMMVFVVLGGLPPGSEPITASAGAHCWTQEPDENNAAFKVRVVAAARHAGAGSVVIGGLPDVRVL